MNWQAHLLTSHWTALAVVPAVLGWLVWPGRAALPWRVLGPALFVLVAGLEVVALTGAAHERIAHPPLWDFKVFYSIGKVAAAGGNVYDPAAYRWLQPALNPGNDAEFKIGMAYPPPAVLLFYPLGLASTLHLAMTLWYVALFATAGIAIVLLQREFFAAHGPAGFAAATAFVLVPVASAQTVELAQLNFLALCLLLGCWRRHDSAVAGSWLAAAVVVRPFLALLAVEFAARRRWGALLATAGGLLGFVALSFPLVGLRGLGSYVRHNPGGRYPESYFDGYDSLYRILVHLGHDTSGYFSLWRHPAYLGLAASAVAASAVVCARAGAAGRDAAFASLVALGLFLYPETGAHYTLLLLPGMALLWRDRDRFGLTSAGAAAAIAVHFVATTFDAATGALCAIDAVVFAALALRPGAPVAALPAVQTASSAIRG